MEITLVDFLWKEKLLVAVAVASGTMLLWPLVRRSAGGPQLTPTQATLLINREDALIIDVREANDYASGHVLGAKNLPLARLASPGADVLKKKDRPVIVYGDASDGALKAAAALKKQGFTRVLSLSGGMGAWQQAGLPVEK